MGELVTTDMSDADDRAEVRAAVKSARAELRESVAAMRARMPKGKLGDKVGVLWLDIEAFDDRVAEWGGEVAAERFICAQVASKVSLDEIAEHYLIERGLLWAFISETDERLQKYYRALRGVADSIVSEVVGISDEQFMVTKENGQQFDPDVPRDKLRIDARLKVAARYDRPRFGEAGGGVAVSTTVNVAPAEDVTTVARKVAFLLRKGLEAAPDDVSDAVVVEHPDDAPGGLTPI